VFAPIVEQVSRETGVNITKMDVDAQASQVQSLGVRSVPTVLFIKDGQEVQRVSGALPKQKLEQLVKQYQ
jgi:thioredoxin 1